MIRFIPPLGGNGDALTSPPGRLTLTVFTWHSLSKVYFNSLNSKLVLTEQHLVVKAWVRITMLLRDRRQSVVLSSTISPVHCLLLYFSQVWDDTAHNQTLNRFVHPQGAKTSSWVIYLKMDLGNFRSVMEHYPPAGKGLETPSVRWWTPSPRTWKALPNKARPGQTALALVLCQSFLNQSPTVMSLRHTGLLLSMLSSWICEESSDTSLKPQPLPAYWTPMWFFRSSTECLRGIVQEYLNNFAGYNENCNICLCIIQMKASASGSFSLPNGKHEPTRGWPQGLSFSDLRMTWQEPQSIPWYMASSPFTPGTSVLEISSLKSWFPSGVLPPPLCLLSDLAPRELDLWLAEKPDTFRRNRSAEQKSLRNKSKP